MLRTRHAALALLAGLLAAGPASAQQTAAPAAPAPAVAPADKGMTTR